ncbi:hypothetical protein [Methylomagnum ishizawai]|uniref:hypothetical protein n=1 Tax=Methylomagnum ishizawai TaxID=1760988 RepID=UPI000F73CB68|nr:hypothetical protein [Methylomagnum ishizawai]
MRKARMPEIFNDLDKIATDLFSSLKEYEKEDRLVPAKIQRAVALLESNLSKIHDSQKSRIQVFINAANDMMAKGLDKDGSWDLYAKLSGVVSGLHQMAKDTKWEE